jgi:hypothetical protein
MGTIARCQQGNNKRPFLIKDRSSKISTSQLCLIELCSCAVGIGKIRIP